MDDFSGGLSNDDGDLPFFCLKPAAGDPARPQTEPDAVAAAAMPAASAAAREILLCCACLWISIRRWSLPLMRRATCWK